jgi:hypothetical protein
MTATYNPQAAADQARAAYRKSQTSSRALSMSRLAIAAVSSLSRVRGIAISSH